MSIVIRWDVCFCPPHAEESIRALAAAVADNWRQELRDEWTALNPVYEVNLEVWLQECLPAKMIWSELLQYWETKELPFSYSPLSLWTTTCIIIKEKEGQLSLGLVVPRGVLLETKGEREQTRMEWAWDEIRRQRGENPLGKRGPDAGDPAYAEWWEKWNRLEVEAESVWPQNKKCMQHIIEKLRGLFPVRSVEVDEQLRGDSSGPPAASASRGD